MHRVLPSMFCGLVFACAASNAAADIPAPSFYPTGAAFAQGYLWNADSSTETLYKMDPDTGAVLATYPSPDSDPGDMEWDGEHILLCGQSSDRIIAIDPANGQVHHSFPAPDGDCLGVAFDGSFIWVADNQNIYQMRPDTGEVIHSVRIVSLYPTGIAVADGIMYVLRGFYGEFVALDPFTAEELWRSDQSGYYYLSWDGSRHLWATNTSTYTIAPFLDIHPGVPQVSITLTDDSIGPGETLRATLHIANDADADQVEIKSWLETPSGNQALLNVPSFNVPAHADLEKAIFSHTFPGGLPEGEYRVGARLMDVVTGSTLSYNLAPFSFNFLESETPFPAAGDSFDVANYPYWYMGGDQVTGTRTVALAGVVGLDLHLGLADNTLSPQVAAALEVRLNGTPLGTVDVRQGDTSADASFRFDSIAGPTYVIELQLTQSIPPNNGSFRVLLGGASTVTLHGDSPARASAAQPATPAAPLPEPAAPTAANRNLPE